MRVNRRNTLKYAGLSAMGMLTLPGLGQAGGGADERITQAAQITPPKYKPEMQKELEILLDLGPTEVLGQSVWGSRSWTPIVGGAVDTNMGTGVIVGGIYRENMKPDGTNEITTEFLMSIDDSDTLVEVGTWGFIRPSITDGGSLPYSRSSASFKAPQGPFDWLNRYIFLSTLTAIEDRKLSLDVFRLG